METRNEMKMTVSTLIRDGCPCRGRIFFYLAGHGFKGLAALKGLIDPFNTLLFVLLESVFDFFGDRVEGEAVDAVSEDDGVVHGIGGADSS